MDIWQFDLRRGSSDDPRSGACLLDAVSWFEYGRLGDHPPCVCPVLAAYGRELNDALPDDRRQELKRFIPRLVGTVDPEAEVARAEYLAWQAVRAFAPPALEIVGLNKHANILRGQTNLVAAAGAVAAAAGATDWAAGAVVRAGARASARASAEAAWASAASAAGADARAAAEAAQWAAAAAARAAIVVSDDWRIYDCAIAALEGALCIGRRAQEAEPEIIERANQAFAAARGELVA